MYTCHTKGNTKKDENFQSYLDQIEEVLNIYSDTHIVLIVGDFNASLSENRGSAQDVQFRSVVDSNSLGYLQNGISTFHHPNKSDHAEIDYVLFNRTGKKYVKSVMVETRDAQNTSDHAPVTAILRLALQSFKPEVTIVSRKPKLGKCDKQMYRQLKYFDSIYIRNSSKLNILYPLGHLNAVLKVATMESIPNYKPETKLKQMKFRPWTEKIYTAAKQSKLKWWEWKKAGASRDPTAANYTRMREAKRCLRREQRREAARGRDQKIESIMIAENDPKTFFRLVKQQRKTAGSQSGGRWEEM